MRNRTDLLYGCLCLLYLLHTTTCDDQSEDINTDKRRLDRYRFLSTLGKRQNEQFIPEDQFADPDKRALDYNMFRSSLGKRDSNMDINDLLSSREGTPSENVYAGLLDEVKRGLDRYGFSARLGKRKYDMDDYQRGQLGRYNFAGTLGKRGLDMNMFGGTLGKRVPLDYRMFTGQLGKRKLDSRMFFGHLGKRAKLDNRMFFGHLGKRDGTNEVSKRARRFPYYFQRANGRPIYTQTRGMDRLSFSARLGKRSSDLGSSENMNYPGSYEAI